MTAGSCRCLPLRPPQAMKVDWLGVSVPIRALTRLLDELLCKCSDS